MASKRGVIALLCGLVGFLAVLSVADSASITWDEAFYMRSVRRNMAWVEILRRDSGQALQQATIDEYWGVAVPEQKTGVGKGDVHPPLVKVAAGLSWRLLRGAIGDLASMRLPSALFFGLALAVLFLWLSDAYGALAGLAATVVLGLMPRFFSYSALLALDAPLASLTLAATYVYWKTIDRPGWRWAIPFGLVWGLALTAKNGGWLLPVGLGVWTLVYYRTWRRLTRLAVAGAIAVLVFVVSWPWLYPDVVDRLAGFIRFSFLGHSSLLEQHTYYLGQLYQKPPWHYPFVIAGLVLPVTTLLMLIAGLAAVMGEGRAARTGWLLVLSMLGPMLPFAAGLVAAYDGERLFLSSFPFMAALAGLGFVRTAEAVWRLLWRRLPRLTARRQSTMVRHAVAAGLLCVVAALPLVSIIRLQPYGLAYYSELAGGVPGAARIGLETTFWGDSYQGLLGYLNEQAGPKATVWADAYYILWAYQDIGRLRKDIIVPGADAPDPLSADFAIVQARQSRYFTPVLAIMTAQRPEAVVQVDGVPLAFVYRIAR